MPGPAGTVTCFTTPDSGAALAFTEDDPHGATPAEAELIRRHGAPLVTRLAAGALLAARERDRLDAFEAATFGLDRSTPAPITADAITAQLGAATATPAVDEAALDRFEAEVFGLRR